MSLRICEKSMQPFMKFLVKSLVRKHYLELKEQLVINSYTTIMKIFKTGVFVNLHITCKIT